MNELTVVMGFPGMLESPSLKLIFDVADFGESKREKASKVAVAAKEMREMIELELGQLGYMYSFWCQELPRAWKLDMAGVFIGGENYLIQAGLGTCEMVLITTDKQGRMEKRRVKDLRKESTLMTENRGLVEIRRKKHKWRFPGVLREIEGFAGSVEPSDELVLTLG